MSAGAGFTEMVRAVATLRAQAARNREALAELRAAFQEEHAGLFSAAAAVERELTEAEAQVKGAAEAHWRATGDKHPAPGVAIREVLRFEYEDAEALAWARETRLALVPETFDRKALERIAKVQPLPFVTRCTEGQATLATDLEAALTLAEQVNPTAPF